MKTNGKYLGLIIMLFFCIACSSDDKTEELTFPSHDIDILFSPSGIGDSGYNDIILYGVQQACGKLGLRLELHQPRTVEDGWKRYEQWRREENNMKSLFIFASGDYEELLRKNPPTRQSDKELLLLESEGELANVASFRLNMYGAAYYIGKLAGRIAPSAAILMANPSDPIIKEAELGFKSGFMSEEKSAYGQFHLSSKPNQGYNMPDSAYYLSYSLFQEYSFVWPLAGGSNMGIYKYTREYPKSIYTAGVDADMSAYSNRIVCSLVKRMDKLLEDYITKWHNGERLEGFSKFGFDSGYVDVDISAGFKESLAELTEGLKEEAITKERNYETNR